ncbi:MAG: phospholipase D family nuclease [Bacteroidota bacterium]
MHIDESCMYLLTKPKRIYRHILVMWVTLLISGVAGCNNGSDHRTPDVAIQVCFSPGGNCTQFVEQAIAKAQETILVQAYFFTSLPIANALIKAHQQGIAIHILIDRSQLKYPYTRIYYMAQKGIPVYVDKTLGIAHNKVMIIDDSYVLTGSFNWTKAAEHCNTENLLLIKDAKTNQAYKNAWHERARYAQQLAEY